MRWLIVGAVRDELAPLRPHLTQPTPPEHLGWARFETGMVDGAAVALLRCGVGKVNAAMATAHAIQQWRPDAILTIGSAGAIDEGLAPGAVVLGAHLVQHDVGYVRGERFVPTGVVVYEVGGGGRQQSHFAADAGLLARAEAASGAAGLTVRVGPIATGDMVVMSATFRRRLAARFGVLAVEMESGAIAQVAAAYAIPCLAIRAVSDTADESIVEAVGGALDATEGLDGVTVAPEAFEATAQLQANLVVAAEAAAAVALATIRWRG